MDLDEVRDTAGQLLEPPSTLRLDELHDVLQQVLGWSHSHLHRFSLGDSA